MKLRTILESYLYVNHLKSYWKNKNRFLLNTSVSGFSEAYSNAQAFPAIEASLAAKGYKVKIIAGGRFWKSSSGWIFTSDFNQKGHGDSVNKDGNGYWIMTKSSFIIIPKKPLFSTLRNDFEQSTFGTIYEKNKNLWTKIDEVFIKENNW